MYPDTVGIGYQSMPIRSQLMNRMARRPKRKPGVDLGRLMAAMGGRAPAFTQGNFAQDMMGMLEQYNRPARRPIGEQEGLVGSIPLDQQTPTAQPGDAQRQALMRAMKAKFAGQAQAEYPIMPHGGLAPGLGGMVGGMLEAPAPAPDQLAAVKMALMNRARNTRSRRRSNMTGLYSRLVGM